jgi:prepilin-type N-terminal cleavage/methylation domain-containing protein
MSRLRDTLWSRCSKAARNESASGFTIIELMVSIILLAVVSSSFLVATNTIFKSVRKQQGVANAADGNRRALTVLDKQVRYASAINTPAIVGGNFYFEYLWTSTQSVTTIDTPTCTQWKLNPTTDLLQYRSWVQAATPTTAPAWTTVDTGVTNDPTTQPPFSFPVLPTGAPVMQYQQLAVNLIAKRDTGNVVTQSTLTALNTSNSAAPTTAVCQGVARS